MVICVRNKEKEKKIGYNTHPLIVINLTRADGMTIRGSHCIMINNKYKLIM